MNGKKRDESERDPRERQKPQDQGDYQDRKRIDEVTDWDKPPKPSRDKDRERHEG
jgi:hypothetical protein